MGETFTTAVRTRRAPRLRVPRPPRRRPRGLHGGAWRGRGATAGPQTGEPPSALAPLRPRGGSLVAPGLRLLPRSATFCADVSCKFPGLLGGVGTWQSCGQGFEPPQLHQRLIKGVAVAAVTPLMFRHQVEVLGFRLPAHARAAARRRSPASRLWRDPDGGAQRIGRPRSKSYCCRRRCSRTRRRAPPGCRRPRVDRDRGAGRRLRVAASARVPEPRRGSASATRGSMP